MKRRLDLLTSELVSLIMLVTHVGVCVVQERNQLMDRQYDTDREKLQRIRLLMVPPHGQVTPLDARLLLVKPLSSAFRLGGTAKSPSCRGRSMRCRVGPSSLSTRRGSWSSTAKVRATRSGFRKDRREAKRLFLCFSICDAQRDEAVLHPLQHVRRQEGLSGEGGQ